MLASKKNIAKKSTIAFIGIMLFFTFFSRTLHYLTTPKVLATITESGYLKDTYTIDSIEPYSENVHSVTIPFKLQQPLPVDQIFIEEGKTVEKGAPLLSFNQYTLNSLIREYKKQVVSLKSELQTFDFGVKDQSSTLQKEIYTTKSELAELEQLMEDGISNLPELKAKAEEIDVLKKQYIQDLNKVEASKAQYEEGSITASEILDMQKELEELSAKIASAEKVYKEQLEKETAEKLRLKEELEYQLKVSTEKLNALQTTGIYNQKSRTLIEMELKDAEEKLQTLIQLQDQDCRILSPVSGTVVSINRNLFQGYMGIDSLIKVNLGESVTAYALRMEKAPKQGFSEDTSCSITLGSQTLQGKITQILLEGTGVCLIMELDRGKSIDFQELKTSNAVLEIKSNYCNIMIPNSAFVSQDEVYVLKSRKGFWGEEYYVVKQKVVLGQSDSSRTEILNGLVKVDKVITSWDRELTDGATVSLPLEN